MKCVYLAMAVIILSAMMTSPAADEDVKGQVLARLEQWAGGKGERDISKKMVADLWGSVARIGEGQRESVLLAFYEKLPPKDFDAKAMAVYLLRKCDITERTFYLLLPDMVRYQDRLGYEIQPLLFNSGLDEELKSIASTLYTRQFKFVKSLSKEQSGRP